MMLLRGLVAGVVVSDISVVLHDDVVVVEDLRDLVSGFTTVSVENFEPADDAQQFFQVGWRRIGDDLAACTLESLPESQPEVSSVGFFFPNGLTFGDGRPLEDF